MNCVSCGLRPAFNLGHPDVRVCRECELERQTHPPLDIAAFVEQSRWTLARRRDHEWTLRDLETPDARRSTCADHASFEAAVRHIREHGTPSSWHGREYVYWSFDGYCYWSMGADPRITTIINRSQEGSSSTAG